MIDGMLAKGHNMTYSKFRVGGSAVQVPRNSKKYYYENIEFGMFACNVGKCQSSQYQI